MNQQIRQFLIDRAHQRAELPISYQDLADACGLSLNMELPHHRKDMGVVLGDISRYEHQEGRPLLSAIVVFKGTYDQGKGFYRLCYTLGIGDAGKLERDLFGMQQLRASFDFWQDAANYATYRG